MPYYPDPYSGWAAGISTLGDSAVKAINAYHENAEKGRFADTMMDEFMKIPGAVPEDIQEKWGKMSSSKKSDSLVAIQFRLARAANQVKQEREEEDRQITNRMHMASTNKDIMEAAKQFGGGGPQLGAEVPTSRGTGIVTSVPGGGSMQLPAATPTPSPRAGQVDLDAQGRPKVDLQRGIYFSGGVPMVLSKEQRDQFTTVQEDAGRQATGLESQIQRQQSKMGQPLASSRYGSREEKLAALQEQRQSKLGMFGKPAAGGAAAAPTAAPSPAAQAIATDRVNVISPPDATGRRKTGSVPHANLQPWLKANPGWSVVPATQASATPAAGPPLAYGQPGRIPSQEEQDLEDLLAV